MKASIKESKISKALNKDLKAARVVVESLEFGTQEWEDAMQIVRDLCQKISDLTPFEPFTSIDGDIFYCKG